ncbi:MAG TPA: PilZ domain-containing protein [Pyrinomonadaceae bacterium]|nr:PilZ domain-containing protein [Pyrinomonadaceae bacterium]
MNFVNSQTPQDERRRYERSRLIIDVFFDGADLTGVASTADISPGGLYMNTQAELPEGAVLTLRIPVEGRDVVCNGEVVYSNPGRGVGVNFQGLSEEDRAHIERALAGR